MDIEDFDTSGNAGVVLPVKHPITGVPLTLADGTAVTLTVAGVDGERYQAAFTTQVNKRLQTSLNARSQQQTAEDLMRENIDLLVAVTLDWQGIEKAGAPLPYSPANARALYERLPWLREQVKAFVEDRANFLKASASA